MMAGGGLTSRLWPRRPPRRRRWRRRRCDASKHRTLLFALVVVLALAERAAAAPNNCYESHLVAQWMFAEGSGSSVADETANGVTMNTSAATSWQSPNGVRAMGESAEAVQSDTGNVAIANALAASNRFTVEIWGRDNSGSSTGTIFALQNGAGCTNLFMISAPSALNLQVNVNCLTYTFNGFFSSGVTFHMAVVWDGSRLQVYRNGVRLGVTSLATSTAGWSGAALNARFFRDPHINTETWQATVFRASVWNQALFVAQVKKLNALGSSATASCSSNPDALLVTSTGTASANEDALWNTFLPTLGFDVQMLAAIDTNVVDSSDTLTSLVVIAESTLSGDVNTKLLNFEGPILTSEGSLWDDFSMCSNDNLNTVNAVGTLVIVNSTHPAMGGLSGTVSLSSQSIDINHVTATTFASGSQRLARHSSNTAASAVRVALSGANAMSGTFRGRRLGTAFRSVTDYAQLTASGITFYRATTTWVSRDMSFSAMAQRDTGVGFGFTVTLLLRGSRTHTWDSVSSVVLSLADNDEGASLSGTTTATASAGVATFAGISISLPGTYRLLASCSGAYQAEPAWSTSFEVWDPMPTVTSYAASDPGADDNSYNAGDTITITFSRAMTPVTVSTKAAIDQFLSFSHAIGNDYTGVWAASNTQLVITIVTPAASEPPIGTATATFSSALVQLRGAALTYPMNAYTTPALTGSFRAVLISSLVASDPDNSDNTYSELDMVTITFNEAVSPVAMTTRLDVDNLLSCSAAIGSEYRGTWAAGNTQLQISILSTASPAPAIGTLTCTLRNTVVQLRDAALTKLPSAATSPALSGNWGTASAAPTIISFVAADPDNGDAEYSVDDTVTITFSAAVDSTVAVATRDDIDKLISFESGFSDDALAADYTGVWASANTQLVITIAVPHVDPGIGELVARFRTDGGVLLRNAAQTSVPISASTAALTGNWGTLAVNAPSITSFVAADPDNGDGQYSAGDTLTLTFSEAMDTTVAVASTGDLDNLMLFSQPIGASYSGSWVSSTQLRIEILTVVDCPPKIGELTVTVKSSPTVLQNAALTSAACTATSPALSGSWGIAPPFLTDLFAWDSTDSDAAYGAGDQIVLVFSEAVQPVGVATKAAVDALVSFSASIGADYSGAFTAGNTRLAITIASPAATAPVIGVLTASLLAGANLRNAAGTSGAAAGGGSAGALRGNWGTRLSSLSAAASATPTLSSNPSHLVGCSIAIVGDLDGDGASDHAVGACPNSGVATSGLIVFVGASQSHLPSGALAAAVAANDAFGAGICGLGSVVGDSKLEVLVGAPFRTSGAGANAGALYLLTLTVAAAVDTFSYVTAASAASPLDSVAAGDNMGFALTSLGDVTGDGVADAAVGFPQVSGGGTGYVLLLTSPWSPAPATAVTLSHTELALANGDQFGAALAFHAASSLLFVGAPGASSGEGTVWAFRLSGAQAVSASRLLSSSFPQMSAGNVLGVSLAAGSRFGAALATLGDFDANGDGDLAVGMPGASATGGAVMVVSFRADSTISWIRRIATQSFALAGSEIGFGLAPVAPGRALDSGHWRVLIADPRRGSGAGAARVISALLSSASDATVSVSDTHWLASLGAVNLDPTLGSLAGTTRRLRTRLQFAVASALTAPASAYTVEVAFSSALTASWVIASPASASVLYIAGTTEAGQPWVRFPLLTTSASGLLEFETAAPSGNEFAVNATVTWLRTPDGSGTTQSITHAIRVDLNVSAASGATVRLGPTSPSAVSATQADTFRVSSYFARDGFAVESAWTSTDPVEDALVRLVASASTAGVSLSLASEADVAFVEAQNATSVTLLASPDAATAAIGALVATPTASNFVGTLAMSLSVSDRGHGGFGAPAQGSTLTLTPTLSVAADTVYRPRITTATSLAAIAEDAAASLAALGLALLEDARLASGAPTITLSVASAAPAVTLSLDAAPMPGVTVVNSSSAWISLSGTRAALSAALSNVYATPPAHWNTLDLFTAAIASVWLETGAADTFFSTADDVPWRVTAVQDAAQNAAACGGALATPSTRLFLACLAFSDVDLADADSPVLVVVSASDASSALALNSTQAAAVDLSATSDTRIVFEAASLAAAQRAVSGLRVSMGTASSNILSVSLRDAGLTWTNTSVDLTAAINTLSLAAPARLVLRAAESASPATLSGVSISHVVLTPATLTVSLACDCCVVTLASLTGLTMVSGTSGVSSSLSFTSLLSNANAALSGLQLTRVDALFNTARGGPCALAISVSDGVQTAAQNVALAVTAVDNAPTASLSGTASSYGVNASEGSCTALSTHITLSDVDETDAAAEELFAVRVAVTVGELSFEPSGSLETVTLTELLTRGTLAQLRGALSTLKFCVGSSGASSGTLTVEVRSGGTSLQTLTATARVFRLLRVIVAERVTVAARDTWTPLGASLSAIAHPEVVSGAVNVTIVIAAQESDKADVSFDAAALAAGVAASATATTTVSLEGAASAVSASLAAGVLRVRSRHSELRSSLPAFTATASAGAFGGTAVVFTVVSSAANAAPTVTYGAGGATSAVSEDEWRSVNVASLSAATSQFQDEFGATLTLTASVASAAAAQLSLAQREGISLPATALGSSVTIKGHAAAVSAAARSLLVQGLATTAAPTSIDLALSDSGTAGASNSALSVSPRAPTLTAAPETVSVAEDAAAAVTVTVASSAAPPVPANLSCSVSHGAIVSITPADATANGLTVLSAAGSTLLLALPLAASATVPLAITPPINMFSAANGTLTLSCQVTDSAGRSRAIDSIAAVTVTAVADRSVTLTPPPSTPLTSMVPVPLALGGADADADPFSAELPRLRVWCSACDLLQMGASGVRVIAANTTSFEVEGALQELLRAAAGSTAHYETTTDFSVALTLGGADATATATAAYNDPRRKRIAGDNEVAGSEDDPLIAVPAISLFAVASAAPVSVTLRFRDGTIDLGAAAGLTFLVGAATGARTVTFSGTAAAANTALAALTLQPAPGWSGASTLLVQAEDQSDGTRLSRLIPVRAAPVGDAPTAALSVAFSSAGDSCARLAVSAEDEGQLFAAVGVMRAEVTSATGSVTTCESALPATLLQGNTELLRQLLRCVVYCTASFASAAESVDVALSDLGFGDPAGTPQTAAASQSVTPGGMVATARLELTDGGAVSVDIASAFATAPLTLSGLASTALAHAATLELRARSPSECTVSMQDASSAWLSGAVVTYAATLADIAPALATVRVACSQASWGIGELDSVLTLVVNGGASTLHAWSATPLLLQPVPALALALAAPINLAPDVRGSAAMTISESPSAGRVLGAVAHVALAIGCGSLSLPLRHGLSFSVGSGSNDAALEFIASLTDAASALAAATVLASWTCVGGTSIAYSVRGRWHDSATWSAVVSGSLTVGVARAPGTPPLFRAATALQSPQQYAEDSGPRTLLPASLEVLYDCVTPLTVDISADAGSTLSHSGLGLSGPTIQLSGPACSLAALFAAVEIEPAADYFGAETVTFVAAAGTATSTWALTVLWTPVADPLTLTAPLPLLSLAQGDTLTLGQGAGTLFTVSDVDGRSNSLFRLDVSSMRSWLAASAVAGDAIGDWLPLAIDSSLGVPVLPPEDWDARRAMTFVAPRAALNTLLTQLRLLTVIDPALSAGDTPPLAVGDAVAVAASVLDDTGAAMETSNSQLPLTVTAPFTPLRLTPLPAARGAVTVTAGASASLGSFIIVAASSLGSAAASHSLSATLAAEGRGALSSADAQGGSTPRTLLLAGTPSSLNISLAAAQYSAPLGASRAFLEDEITVAVSGAVTATLAVRVSPQTPQSCALSFTQLAASLQVPRLGAVLAGAALRLEVRDAWFGEVVAVRASSTGPSLFSFSPVVAPLATASPASAVSPLAVAAPLAVTTAAPSAPAAVTTLLVHSPLAHVCGASETVTVEAEAASGSVSASFTLTVVC